MLCTEDLPDLVVRLVDATFHRSTHFVPFVRSLGYVIAFGDLHVRAEVNREAFDPSDLNPVGAGLKCVGYVMPSVFRRSIQLSYLQIVWRGGFEPPTSRSIGDN